MVNKEFLAQNVTIIIRTVGERTTSLCSLLLENHISKENILEINETPFTQAIRKTFEIGVQQNRKWTFVVDADVLIRPNLLIELLNYAETTDERIFEIEGKIIDKFLPSPREAGNHLYRTSLMQYAIELIPDPLKEIRPETYVKNKMREKGFDWQVVDLIIGFHDFEQSYEDIYRKSFIQAKKHGDKVKKDLNQWKELAKKDDDFKIAIKGFLDGEKFKNKIAIDANSKEIKIGFNKLLNSYLREKSDLNEYDQTRLLYTFSETLAYISRAKNNSLLEKEKEIELLNKSSFYIKKKFKKFMRKIFKKKA